MSPIVWSAAARRRAGRPRQPTLRVGMVAASLRILGGQGVQAAALVQSLAADGVQVRFVPIDTALPTGLRWLRRLPGVRTLVNQILYWPRLWPLARVDVVHAFSASYWSFLLAPLPAMLIGRVFDKRVILHYHSGEAEDHLARWGVLVHPWLKLADEIVVPSEYLRAVFARHGYRATVIANIVDVSAFVYRDRDLTRPRFLSTRNLEPYYDVETTIQAFARIQARVPDATLAVAGIGSREPALRALADRLGLRGVNFLGRVEPDDMPTLCDGAEIFLNASIVDNQPVSILEAFAAGLPVVTTPTGAIGEMVRHGQTGLIVPPRDPEAMAAAALELLCRPAWARALAAQARQVVAAYRWVAVRDAWAEAYAPAVPSPRRALSA